MLNERFIFDIETSGLHAITDRITCISILNLSTNKITSFYGEDEKKILIDFWKVVDGAIEIIGYNITFDIPFLLQRTLINNVSVSKTYFKIKKVDLMLLSTGFFEVYKRGIKGNLDQWSNHFGMGGKKTSGEEMIEFFKKRNWNEIKKHCEDDVLITSKLYWRLSECGLFQVPPIK